MQFYEPVLDSGATQVWRRSFLAPSPSQRTSGCNERLSIKIFDRSTLSTLLPDWTDLAGRAAEDNVYYAPHYAMPLLQTVDRNQAVTIVTVWDQTSLIALLPVVTRRVPVPGLVAAGGAWETEHTYSCTPVLDRVRLQDAARGLVQALSSLRSGEWEIPNVRLNGPAGKALCAALDERNAPWAAPASFKRAMLAKGLSFNDHMQSRVASKRRRELARNRRRLEELGVVSHRSVTAGKDLDHALSEYLRIEASGWKGKRGTALACRPSDAEFARQAFGARGGNSNCRIDMLLLDDRPVAAGLIVFSGRTGFTVKNAYDEAYASFSAGLLLEVEVIKSFLNEDWASQLDSGTSGGHVIEHLWPDSMEIGNVYFSLASTAPRARLNSYVKLQALQADTKNRLKSVTGR